MAIVMTSQQFCDRLKYLAMKRNSVYRNRYPQNCLYIQSASVISADCSNLIKSLINDPTAYKRTAPVGWYVSPGQNIPDVDIRGVLNLCSNVSTVFSNMIPGEFLSILGDDGNKHAGVYVGEFNDGGICNTVECTTDWGANGITTSYTDANGYRYNHKGGTRAYSKWDHHGRLYRYINYGSQPTPTPSKKIAVDGAWGPATTKLAVYVYSTIHKQKITDTDKVTSQMASLKKYHLNCETSSWQYTADGAAKGSDLIKAMQRVIGELAVDGQAGPGTIKRLQHELQSYGAGNMDGYMGYKTVTAFQKWLNSKVN